MSGNALSGNGLKVCVDRVVPPEHDPVAAATHDALRSLRRSSLPGAAGEAVAVRMAIVRLKKWPPGATLRCRFLDGSQVQRERAIQVALRWETVANVRLQFVQSGDAEVRIAFRKGEGSWSAVGNDCLVEKYFPAHQPTMNFGWLADDTDQIEVNRVVLHEFGHALGCIHEHQQPNAALEWNRQAVYSYFSGPPNYWTREQVDHNVFDRYSREETNSSAFDRSSIMLYPFPAEFFVGGAGTPSNTDLSPTDRAFIASVYPRL
jgi:hypothetical protein